MWRESSVSYLKNTMTYVLSVRWKSQFKNLSVNKIYLVFTQVKKGPSNRLLFFIPQSAKVFSVDISVAEE
jgi:hypothetical protein